VNIFNNEPLSQFENSEFSGQFKLIKKRTKLKKKRTSLNKDLSPTKSSDTKSKGALSIFNKLNSEFKKKVVIPKQQFLRKKSAVGSTELSVVEEATAT
jgi:hypothetical protein